AVKWAGTVWGKAGPALTAFLGRIGARAFDRIEATFSPRGTLARGGLTNSMAMWSAVLLAVVMLVVLIAS
ncbi:MAG: Na(+)/H(+) antiporter subunit D, partial [Pseudomonadota bacterium]